MTKLQFLLEAPAAEPLGAFQARILGDVAPRLLEHDPRRLQVVLTTEAAPRLTLVPFRRHRLAVISIWEADGSAAAARAWRERLGPWDLGPLAGYRVEESIPRAYDRTWPDGTQSPGAGLLTLLQRRPGQTDEQFQRRWFESHSPLAMRIHPMWNYVRNVVREPLVEGSPAWDGIVEEHFRRREDFVNPVRLFGGARRLLPNLVTTAVDLARTFHPLRMRNYLVSEHWLRSGSGTGEAPRPVESFV